MVLSLKSPSFIYRSLVINTFKGLMSLWMISCEWQCNSAKLSYQATYHISFSEKYFLFDFYSLIRVYISPYSANSMAMYILIFLWWVPIVPKSFSVYWELPKDSWFCRLGGSSGFSVFFLKAAVSNCRSIKESYSYIILGWVILFIIATSFSTSL